MAGLFSKPKMPDPPAIPKPEDTAADEARNKVRLMAAKAKGRSSTILTGGAGLTTDAPVNLKKALGQ